jgi:hypothetical protein
VMSRRAVPTCKDWDQAANGRSIKAKARIVTAYDRFQGGIKRQSVSCQ